MTEDLTMDSNELDINSGIEGFDDLDAMFGQDASDMEKMAKTTLTQSLEGFASCFPEWDLHPPVR